MQTFADSALCGSLASPCRERHESRREPVSIYDRLPRVCVLLESLGPAVTADQAGVVIRAWRKDGDSWVSVPMGSRLHEELLMWADHVGAGRSGKGGRRGDVWVYSFTSDLSKATLFLGLTAHSLAENGLDCMKRLKKKQNLDCTEVTFSAL